MDFRMNRVVGEESGRDVGWGKRVSGSVSNLALTPECAKGQIRHLCQRRRCQGGVCGLLAHVHGYAHEGNAMPFVLALVCPSNDRSMGRTPRTCFFSSFLAWRSASAIGLTASRR